MYDQSSRAKRGIQPQPSADIEPKRLVKLDETVDGTASRQDIIARSVQGCKSHQVANKTGSNSCPTSPSPKNIKRAKRYKYTESVRQVSVSSIPDSA
jgi:hypothetical protein